MFFESWAGIVWVVLKGTVEGFFSRRGGLIGWKDKVREKGARVVFRKELFFFLKDVFWRGFGIDLGEGGEGGEEEEKEVLKIWEWGVGGSNGLKRRGAGEKKHFVFHAREGFQKGGRLKGCLKGGFRRVGGWRGGSVGSGLALKKGRESKQGLKYRVSMKVVFLFKERSKKYWM